MRLLASSDGYSSLQTFLCHCSIPIVALLSGDCACVATRSAIFCISRTSGQSLTTRFADGNSPVIIALLQRTIGDNDADAPESTAPLSTQIMALCATANFVSHSGYTHDFALSSGLSHALLRSLRSSKPAVRMMGATVIYNCSLHLRFDSLDHEDRDDVAIQYISALAECLPSEKNAPTRIRGDVDLSTSLQALLTLCTSCGIIYSSSSAISPGILHGKRGFSALASAWF